MMARSAGIFVSMICCIAFLAFGEAPALMAQTHSISGRIVIEGRGKYGGTVVWVDSLHVSGTDSLGNYTIAGFDDGIYAVKAWAEYCLARIVDTVQVSGRDVPGMNDTLFAGDIVEDGRINLLDAAKILQRLHAAAGSGSRDELLDLDRSGVIDSLDIAALMRHWRKANEVAPPLHIEVTEPAGTIFWTLGQHDVSISWQTGGLQGTVSIVLYRGESQVATIADAAPNSGTFSAYNVPVDLIPGTSYRVAVRFSETNYDYSDYFEIKSAIFVMLPDSSTVWSPGQQDVPIHWTTGSLGGPVSISIYKGLSLIQEIAASTPNNGVYMAYDVPESLVPGKDYRIQVLHVDSGVFGYSDYFEIRRFIIVTEPARTTIWVRGQKSVPVTWITGNFSGDVTINLFKGTSQLRQLSQGYPNNGARQVDVPTGIPPGADYRVQVYLDADRNDFSDYFTIQVPFAVTAPDTNAVWLPGQANAPIRWESSSMTGSVSIGLYQAGNLVLTVASSIPNNGQYSGYSVPAGLAPSAGYQIRIDSDAGKYALSEHFEVEKPSGWSWWFGGYDLTSVCFADASTGTAVGEYGTILRTTDGGATWVRQWGSTRKKLYGVAFHDANTGLAVGQGGVILKTTDGGATWVSKESGRRGDLYSVSYADADTAVAVGVGATPILFCRTTDGGETWTTYEVNYFTTPHAVSFVDAKTGAVLGDAGAVYSTKDGGATWNETRVAWGEPGDKATGILALDANTWVATGWHRYYNYDGQLTYQGVIYKTQTAGAGWIRRYAGSLLNAVSFSDANTGTAVGESGTILRTVDGGVTWTRQTSGLGSALSGVSFTDANNGTAVGASGTIIRTTDGGATWVLRTPSTPYTLRGICFTSANTGMVVGGNDYSGVILRTTDAGATWSSYLSSGAALNGISMATPDTGTAVGGYYDSGAPDVGVPPQSHGVILRTTDGGATWVAQVSSRTFFKGVRFSDSNTGTAFGTTRYYVSGAYWADSCVVLRTQDGGATWVPLPIRSCFADVWFSDANMGTALTGGTTIYRTVDGGVTWVPHASGASQGLTSVYFSDANTGTVVGRGGTILRTVDGGATWISQTSGTSEDLFGVRFVDANTGIAVGVGGTILRTTDGGVTWVKQNSGTTRDFYAVHLWDANTAIVVGDRGTVLGTTTGGE